MLKITELELNEPVFDITVEDNHNFYANGVLVSNCVEINQAVEPLKSIDDPDSEIGVCILSAINWLEISSDDEMEKACDVVVRMLDEIIDIQDYFDLAAKNFAQGKRSIGVGVTNLAAFLAKNKLKYTDEEALLLVDEWMEKQQYYLIKASIKLAQEKGKCSKFETSKYSNGFLPIDKEYKEVLIKRKPSMDWKSLRSELKEHGMRHTTLSTIMPCESCLKWDTKISTVDGEIDFHQICEKGGIDWRSIEDTKNPKWFKLQSPISVNTKDGIFEVNDIYYNGFKETFSIEMDNGEIIIATGNHKFLTPSGWKKVAELTENDEILEWEV